MCWIWNRESEIFDFRKPGVKSIAEVFTLLIPIFYKKNVAFLENEKYYL